MAEYQVVGGIDQTTPHNAYVGFYPELDINSSNLVNESMRFMRRTSSDYYQTGTGTELKITDTQCIKPQQIEQTVNQLSCTLRDAGHSVITHATIVDVTGQEELLVQLKQQLAVQE